MESKRFSIGYLCPREMVLKCLTPSIVAHKSPTRKGNTWGGVSSLPILFLHFWGLSHLSSPLFYQLLLLYFLSGLFDFSTGFITSVFSRNIDEAEWSPGSLPRGSSKRNNRQLIYNIVLRQQSAGIVFM